VPGLASRVRSSVESALLWLSTDDTSEGYIAADLHAKDGGVIIEFDRAITHYAFPNPEQAEDFAERLKHTAAEARRCRCRR
jgi:hypothetical protein